MHQRVFNGLTVSCLLGGMAVLFAVVMTGEDVSKSLSFVCLLDYSLGVPRSGLERPEGRSIFKALASYC